MALGYSCCNGFPIYYMIVFYFKLPVIFPVLRWFNIEFIKQFFSLWFKLKHLVSLVFFSSCSPLDWNFHLKE